jgi:hypothetical protein
LEPLHPDEPELHRQLRDALNEGLTNTDFFVWITVRPTGHQNRFSYLPRIVQRTDRWLASLDPDAPQEDRKSSFDPAALLNAEFQDPAADVRIRAIPKKPEARGRRAAEIVGNPEPALAGYGD